MLTYKTSGIFNFGHGALATAAAYVFYWLYVDHQVDWRLAAFLSVFVLGPAMGLVMELIARRLAPQRTAWKIVGTVGLILVVQGLGTIKYGTDPISVPQYLPKGTETFRVFDVNIGYDQLIITIISVVAVAGLYTLFRFTRLGIACAPSWTIPTCWTSRGPARPGCAGSRGSSARRSPRCRAC